MALDGQPAEPFLARNGALVLAPGGRVDAFIDVTAPPGSTSSILLHDGKEARPIGRLVVSSEPPLARRAAAAGPAAALQRPAGAARPQERRCASIWRSADRSADWVTPANFASHRRRPPSAPRPAAPWCWR